MDPENSAPPVIDLLAKIFGVKRNTVALKKKTEHEWMAKIALDMQSNGPTWQIAVEASMGGTNYTFR
jgi:hypothetical protein